MKLYYTFLIFLSFQALAGGLPRVVLSGKQGETLEGKTFDSSIITGKTYLFIHMDPDARDLNEGVDEALKKRNFKGENYGSIAVINAASTWIPNSILKMALRKEQRNFPDTIYVLDYSKSFVDQWNLKDNSSTYMVFNRKGIPIFRVDGRLDQKDKKRLLETLEKNI